MKKLLSLCLVFILVACSQNIENEDWGQSPTGLLNLTQEELLSIAYDNPKELSADEAASIATDFLNAIKEKEEDNGALTRSINSDFTLHVTSKTYFAPENSSSTRTASCDEIKLPIYEVSITSDDGRGVVYVSADERNAEVITFIPQVAPNEELFVKSGSAFLVKWAETSAYERLLEVNKMRKELHDATITKISNELGIDESEVTLDNISDKITVNGTRSTPIQTPSTQIVTMRSPIVETEWSQESPYNLSLPTPNAPSTQSHVYTGCAVTAACQLMTAIKPDLTLDGTVINWDYLTQDPKITASAPQDKLEMLGKLHSWVFDQLEATPRYDIYGYHNATGVSAANQIWFYGNYFNHSEDYSAYDPDALLRSFNAGRPSLIRGQGHAWLVDGYIIAQKTANPKSATNRAVIIQYYDMFWHANLGWGGSANGYYKLKPDAHVEFESGNYRFTTDGLYIYPGLYKKSTSYNF